MISLRSGLCAALLASLPAVVAAQVAPIRLEVGKSHTLFTGGEIKQLLVSTAGVVTLAAPKPHEVRLTADAAGATDLTVVTSRGRLTYPIVVAEKGAAAAKTAERRIQAEPGLKDVAVRTAGEAMVASGQADDLMAQGRVRAVAGQPVTNNVEVEGRQVVAVDVRFVAISDKTLKELGFNFAKLGQGIEWAIFPPSTLNSATVNAAGLQLDGVQPFENAFNLVLHNRSEGVIGMLSALSDAGLSEVLAQPTLMARSGEKAEFLAGGDVPIPVAQGGSASGAITIEYRPYGVRLAVEPYVLSNKRIVLKLAPEVSELDYTNAVQTQGFTVPGFKRRSASTTVELADGQSFVIAGLTYSASTTNDSKTPGLGDVPVLGAFFKTAQHSREKLELIIVATPRLVAPLEASDLTDLKATPPPPPPSMLDILSGANGAERRAARVGLSR
jgi:pilus assembly protein CpaC